MRTRLMAASLLIGLTASACSSATVADSEIPRVNGTDILAVATVTPIAQVKADRGKDTRWLVSVDTVQFERGTYTINAGREKRYFDFPGEGEVRIYFADGIHPTEGVPIVVSLTAVSAGGPWPNSYTWRTDLVLTGDGSTVHAGVNEQLAASLQSAVLGSETLLSALIGLGEEAKVWIRETEAATAQVRTQEYATDDLQDEAEYAARAAIDRGARHRAVEEALIAALPPPPAPDTGEAFLAAAPINRQAPISTQFIQDWDESVKTELSTDKWVQWTVWITMDDATRASASWVGLYLEGHGFFGPTGINDDVTPVVGIAPPEASVSLLTWAEGIPEDVWPVNDNASRATAPKKHRAPKSYLIAAPPNGEIIYIDVQRGQIATIDLLTIDEADQFGRERFVPETTP